MASNEANIIAITETWLTSDISNNEVLPSNFHLHRKDREETCPNKRGGGVLLAVDNVLQSKRRGDLEPDCELLVCEVCLHHEPRLAIILCYRPPNTDKADFNRYLNETLCRVNSEFDNICLLGDFNLPDINWKIPCTNLWLMTRTL